MHAVFVFAAVAADDDDDDDERVADERGRGKRAEKEITLYFISRHVLR